jgi:L-lactate dehydrogenase complex protein LldE
VCCGFGGTFCVKYPDISNAILIDKITDIGNTNADTLLAGDLGCLLNMAGKLLRDGKAVRVRHTAEVLAGMGDTAPIGEPEATGSHVSDRARPRAHRRASAGS